MKSFGIILCLAVSFLSSIAQEKFDPGYIMRNNRDTLKGYIRHALEEEYSGRVDFKPDSISPAQVLSPADIVSFGKGRDIYRSIVFRNTSSEGMGPDTCFAKQLVTGKYNLFTFSRRERRYYIIRTDTTTYLLFNSVMSNMGELIAQGNYINMLNLISVPCDKLASQYDRVGYGEREMSRFIFALNKCVTPETAENYYHKPDTRTEIYGYAGAMRLSRERSQFAAQATMRIFYPGISAKTSVNIGLRYTYVVSTSVESNYYFGIYQVKTNHRAFSIPATIQYDFLTGRIRPYFYGGLGVAYLSEHSEGKHLDGPPDKNKFGVSFIVGAGIQARIIDKLFVQADWRYELLVQYPVIGIAYQFK